MIEQIRSRTSNFWVDYSRSANLKSWMNHCNSCGAKQGDFYLYCEPSGAFLNDEISSGDVILEPIAEDFACGGTVVYGEHFFEGMMLIGQVWQAQKLLFPPYRATLANEEQKKPRKKDFFGFRRTSA